MQCKHWLFQAEDYLKPLAVNQQVTIADGSSEMELQQLPGGASAKPEKSTRGSPEDDQVGLAVKIKLDSIKRLLIEDELNIRS